MVALGDCNIVTAPAAEVDADWRARANAPSVLMATRFDAAAEVSDYTLQDSEADHVSWERDNVASGNGSLRFDILNTDESNSGNWVRHLSNDRREFGPQETFYVQFRQYIPQYLATYLFRGEQYGGAYGAGWKQLIISNRRGSNQLFEIVLQNTEHRGLVQGYNRDSEGSYPPWQQLMVTPCSSTDFVFQNMIDRGGPENTCLDSRRKRGGLYSYGSNTGFPDPETGAFIYYPDEWLTFLLRISPGTFGQGADVYDTNVRVFAARQADTDYTLLFDVMINLGAGLDSFGNQYYFDAIWLLPYHTNKLSDPTAQNTYTLYDEVIVSTAFIPAPQASGGPSTTVTPSRITDLVAN